MSQATNDTRTPALAVRRRMSVDEAAAILEEHGLSRLIVELRNVDYDTDEILAMIDRHQESFGERTRRAFVATLDAFF
jgi:CBS domain-containing protein